MEDECMEDIRKAMEQVYEIKRREGLCRKEIKRQAEDYICSLNRKSDEDVKKRERELCMRKEEIRQIQQDIKDGKVKELLRKYKAGGE